MNDSLLSIVTFLPLVGAVVLLAFPRGNSPGARGFALAISGVTLLVSLVVWQRFDVANDHLQLVERVSWIPQIGAQYLLGVDGLSLFLVLLTTFLTPIVIISTYSGVTDKVREYLICMLALETAMLGALVAQDLLLFYVFWEAMLIPMYFLIGVFGGKKRIDATIKFFLFTMSGSVLMLVAIIYLYLHSGSADARAFDLAQLSKNTLDIGPQRWLFAAFALAFAIKVPMFPLHTWLPDAHVEAPTGGSVILAGVMLKMGTYGFLRFAIPLFPRAALSFMPLIAVLGVIGIVYGALVSMVQTDMKKVVAYSSVSHLGFVMLGIAAMSTTAVSGAVYQMLNHGVSTGALFLLVGVIYERRHTRLIADYGGLATIMPVYAAVFLIVGLSSIGLPGLNGFVGEFMILAGTARSKVLPATIGFPMGIGAGLLAFAGLGVIFAAVYILWMYQRVFFGPVTKDENRAVSDLSAREFAMLVPLLIAIVVMGVVPRVFLSSVEPTVRRLVTDFQLANNISPESGSAPHAALNVVPNNLAPNPSQPQPLRPIGAPQALPTPNPANVNPPFRVPTAPH